MNYIILCATAIISKEKIRYFRIFCASLCGAVYAIFAYVSALKIYSAFLLKVLLSVAIIYIAFHPPNAKLMLKELLLFYLTSFVFGGVAISLIYLISPQDVTIKNGVFVGSYPIKVVLLGAIVGFFVIVVAFKIAKTKLNKNSLLCNVKIRLNNKDVDVVAMIDTGNLLKDPISNMPVIVVEHTALYDVIPKEVLNNLENILGGGIEFLPDSVRAGYISRLKVIPFSSLGKQNGMLLGIKAQEVRIDGEARNMVKNNVIVGMYDKPLTKKGEYRALVGMNLLEGNYEFD
jgi:stage II sporulation protein GA (sporulation sigma-E factor processing peptidase)